MAVRACSLNFRTTFHSRFDVFLGKKITVISSPGA
jgi:hypothetical protein